MKNYRIFLCIAFWVICGSVLLGCFDEITFDQDETQLENLVIQGKLLHGSPSVVSVSVSRVASFGSPEPATPVEAARVSLLDENQNSVDLIATESGMFQLEIPEDPPGFTVEAGHAYQVKVLLETGAEYESTLEPLLAVPSANSIDLELINREEINVSGNNQVFTYLQFYINTPLLAANSDQKSFLKWELEGCYRFIESADGSAPFPDPKTCYYKESVDLDKVKVFNGQASDINDLNGHFLVEIEQGYRFSRGYYLTAYQQSLSEKAFEYWENVSQIVERTGSIFESTPGKIKGNFRNLDNPSEEIFGYFYATIQDTVRLKVLTEEAGFPNPFCPPDNNVPGGVTAECLNCLLRPGSSLIKPDFWED